jgi:hypothetical protein
VGGLKRTGVEYVQSYDAFRATARATKTTDPEIRFCGSINGCAGKR